MKPCQKEETKMKKMITPDSFKKASTPIVIPQEYDWKTQSRGDIVKYGTFATTTQGCGTGIQDTDSISD